ncbi:zinc finger protein 287 [Astyanax mexicanus]|uniref:zinc finger protein 287 n=1 Tax=Astyanax mexicanus TaxID=7994 RepID=UPI000BBE0566|nr:zinc finger protein 287 [Astyanax mexicanus]
MAAAVVLQTQISAILEVLAKAAVAEISQLIQEDSVVLHLEIKRREDEIDGLKKRLHVTEKELKKAQAVPDKCSIGVQAEILDTDLIPSRNRLLPGNPLQTFDTVLQQTPKDEKPQPSHRMQTPPQHIPEEPQSAAQTFAPESSSKPQPQQVCDEDEFSRLEFEMKMEQVEELVDQELNLQRANYRTVCTEAGSNQKTGAQMWSPVDDDDSVTDYIMPDGTMGLEQYQQVPTEPCAEPVPHPQLPANIQNSPGNMLPLWERTAAVQLRTKPFRCEQCGKRFTQRTRLITHRRIHTGEKPYHCQLCGKMFSRQDNCLRHVRLHSGQRW